MCKILLTTIINYIHRQIINLPKLTKDDQELLDKLNSNPVSSLKEKWAKLEIISSIVQNQFSRLQNISNHEENCDRIKTLQCGHWQG